jgi:hypothetical protein
MEKISIKIKGNLAQVKKAIRKLGTAQPEEKETPLRYADARARLKKAKV